MFMTGRIHDVDLDGLIRLRIDQRDGCILGEDRNAALTLEVIGIHDSLGNLLVLAEGMRLAQETIHECRLAVVNVGDDRDIS
jgi:hypothetical protein